MELLENIKQRVKFQSLNTEDRGSIKIINSIDFNDEFIKLSDTFKMLSDKISDNNKEVVLILGKINGNEKDFIERAFNIRMLKASNDSIITRCDKELVELQFRPLSIDQNYNIVLHYNNQLKLDLMSPITYEQFIDTHNIFNINSFSPNLKLNDNEKVYFIIMYFMCRTYSIDLQTLVNKLVEISNLSITNVKDECLNVMDLIHKIIRMNKSLIDNSSKILETTSNIQQFTKNEMQEFIMENSRELKKSTYKSTKTCVVITKFSMDVMVTFSEYIVNHNCIDTIQHIESNSLNIKSNRDLYKLRNTEYSGELALVILSNDIDKFGVNHIKIILQSELEELKNDNINIIDTEIISYDKYNLDLVCNLVGDNPKLSSVGHLDINKAFNVIKYNNIIIEITKILKDKIEDNTNKVIDDIKNIELEGTLPDNSLEGAIKDKEFKNKIANIQSSINNAEIKSDEITNKEENSSTCTIEEMSKRLHSIHSSISNLLECCLRADIKCHYIQHMEDDIIAIPLVKVNHNLINKITLDNKGVLYIGKNSNGKRKYKFTGIPIINNYIYRYINDRLWEEFGEGRKLLNPLIIQGQINNRAYKDARENLIKDIENNKLNTFFMLMLIVYKGNILIQLWDKDYFIKQLKKNNIKYIKYSEDSSNGITYVDINNSKIISRDREVDGAEKQRHDNKLVKAIGLDSDSSDSEEELMYINGIISLFKVITNDSDYDYFNKDYDERFNIVNCAYDRNKRLLNKDVNIKFADILKNNELYSRCQKLLYTLSICATNELRVK